MPAKAKVTKEMILDAAFAVAREAGAENINARTVSERLHCSTQPIMYHFKPIEALKRETYAAADRYHSEYLMDLKRPQRGVMLGIGMNYIRFAIEEPHLFRFLFQSHQIKQGRFSEQPCVRKCKCNQHDDYKGKDCLYCCRVN